MNYFTSTSCSCTCEETLEVVSVISYCVALEASFSISLLRDFYFLDSVVHYDGLIELAS